MLVDTHCHLDQFDDVEVVIETASEQGVTRLVVVSEDPESMRRVLELKHQHPTHVLAGLGLHPVWIIQTAMRCRVRLSNSKRYYPKPMNWARLGSIINGRQNA